MSTPNKLKTEFNELFEKQKAIENDSAFIAKKRKYQDIKLESKHDLSTLSEIFQDPELLARISNETYFFIKLKDRGSRVRNHLELVTNKKPQAKDVYTNRVIADDELERIRAVEENIKNQNEYINPVASKKRRYLAQDIQDQAITLEAEPVITTELANKTGLLDNVETVDGLEAMDKDEGDKEGEEDQNSSELNSVDTPANSINSNLALPSIRSTENANSTNEVQEDDENSLEKSFKETALLFKESPLKTVGSKYFYTLLPRQCDTNAYKYVKEDYTPQNNTNKNDNERDEWSTLDDTLLTITVFNPAKTNKKFQEIEILGSQKLSDFRDSVYCLSDFSSNGDRKNKDPNGEIINTSEKKLSPSIIYLDHVFYIDTRLDDHPEDYYEDLIETWLTKKGVNKRVFKYEIKNMQDILWEDTPLKLHQPFVFLHQDKCEHMILVQDVRLLSPFEYKSKDEFPRTTHNLKYDRFKCSMCTIYPATKITEEEIISGFSPCYFCDNCFQSFHNENDNVNAREYSGTAGGDIKLRSHRY